MDNENKPQPKKEDEEKQPSSLIPPRPTPPIQAKPSKDITAEEEKDRRILLIEEIANSKKK